MGWVAGVDLAGSCEIWFGVGLVQYNFLLGFCLVWCFVHCGVVVCLFRVYAGGLTECCGLAAVVVGFYCWWLLGGMDW